MITEGGLMIKNFELTIIPYILGATFSYMFFDISTDLYVGFVASAVVFGIFNKDVEWY